VPADARARHERANGMAERPRLAAATVPGGARSATGGAAVQLDAIGVAVVEPVAANAKTSGTARQPATRFAALRGNAARARKEGLRTPGNANGGRVCCQVCAAAGFGGRGERVYVFVCSSAVWGRGLRCVPLAGAAGADSSSSRTGQVRPAI